MKTVCPIDMCSGCMACVSTCKKNAITIKDEIDTYNAVIDSTKCVNCGLCEWVCQRNHLVEEPRKPIDWYQGWANDADIRSKASSGGAATAIIQSFIRSGGVVCSCVYKIGRFGFDFSDNINDLEKFIGSKYIKSNPEGIYEPVKQYLKEGKKLLFIGLPCQIAAVKNYIGLQLRENLYTIDLICHGTPSPKVMDIFLGQYKKLTHQQTAFRFRDKDMFQVAVSDQYIVQKGSADRYSIAFLNSLIYTENCYSCNYACLERISDITLGDSWRSDLPVMECKKGISLVLVQTEKGREMLMQADMHLEDVDLDKAVKANHQLEHPSFKCINSEKFWTLLKAGKRFNWLVLCKFPKHCVRQNIKCLLLKLKIIHR